MNRRELIRGIGRALCAGATVPFIPSLLPMSSVIEEPYLLQLEDLYRAMLTNIRAHGEIYIVSTPPRTVYGESVVEGYFKKKEEV